MSYLVNIGIIFMNEYLNWKAEVKWRSIPQLFENFLKCAQSVIVPDFQSTHETVSRVHDAYLIGGAQTCTDPTRTVADCKNSLRLPVSPFVDVLPVRKYLGFGCSDST